MQHCPALGQEATRPCSGGCPTKPVRVLSVPAVVQADGWRPYVCRRFRNLPGRYQTDPATGNPYIATRAEERSIIAASKDTSFPLARE